MKQMHPTPEQLLDYRRGELGPAEDAVIHAHLSACGPCAGERDAQSELTDLLRALPVVRERAMPIGLASRIRAAAAEHAESTPWFRRRLAPVAAFATAAAAAVAIIAGVHVAATQHPATIDAAFFMNDHDSLASTAPFSGGSESAAVLASGDAFTEPANASR